MLTVYGRTTHCVWAKANQTLFWNTLYYNHYSVSQNVLAIFSQFACCVDLQMSIY
jgi:hypothetical protein